MPPTSSFEAFAPSPQPLGALSLRRPADAFALARAAVALFLVCGCDVCRLPFGAGLRRGLVLRLLRPLLPRPLLPLLRPRLRPRLALLDGTTEVATGLLRLPPPRLLLLPPPRLLLLLPPRLFLLLPPRLLLSLTISRLTLGVRRLRRRLRFLGAASIVLQSNAMEAKAHVLLQKD